jgi:hypothetical protein
VSPHNSNTTEGKTMKSKHFWALLAALIGVAAYGAVASATPPSGLSNPPWSPIIGRFAGGIDATAKTDINPGSARDFWRTRIQAKGAIDVHSAPSAPTTPDGTPQNFGPTSTLGSTFVDQGHDLHMVRNNGTVDADVYVVSSVPAGFQRRIDKPNPNPSICPNGARARSASPASRDVRARRGTGHG